MWIGIQISSYLIPQAIWEHGDEKSPGLSPLALVARDALEIERRARKEIKLRNEAHRYTLCCERMQAIVMELARRGAPLPPPVVWQAYDVAGVAHPRAIAYLALCEYLSRFYKVERNGRAENLRHDRIEAIFLPPEKHVRRLLDLYEHIRENPHLPKVFAAAAEKAEIAAPTLKIAPEECALAFTARYQLIKRCADESCGAVDVIEIV